MDLDGDREQDRILLYVNQHWHVSDIKDTNGWFYQQ